MRNESRITLVVWTIYRSVWFIVSDLMTVGFRLFDVKSLIIAFKFFTFCNEFPDIHCSVGEGYLSLHFVIRNFARKLTCF